jgi:hypothetical protein
MNYEDEKESKSKRRTGERSSGDDNDHWRPISDERESDAGRHLRNGVVNSVSGYTQSINKLIDREVAQNQASNGHASLNSFSVHSMHLEMIRLGSFHNFPSASSVSTVKLARQGFYYSGDGDKVICFACGFERSGWRAGDDANSVHREASPNCPLLQSSGASNVQIGRRQSNGANENSEIREADQSRGYRRDLPADGTSPMVSNNALPNSPPESSSANGDLQGNNVQSPPIGNSHARTRAIQEKINTFMRDLDPLGINFDRPKYPSYSVLAVRISSFSDWPSSIAQTPRDLAVAGFLYAGYGDYTRCFFCGGGLRNWEPGDDPWTEHARWFPKCAFLRQNKGDEFVALVQIEHQEQVSFIGNEEIFVSN